MAAKTQRTKRCKKCNKIIRAFNKSGYCSTCGMKENAKERMRKKCSICQEPCSGNMLIEVSKRRYISLCTEHFYILNLINDPKKLRERIKYLRSYH